MRNAQSSVESSSVEKLGLFTQNNGHGGGLNSGINDGASQSSNSLFDRNAFQKYSERKLKVILQDSEHSKLIKFREDVLKYQENKERRQIKKQFKRGQFSPRTFQAKQK